MAGMYVRGIVEMREKLRNLARNCPDEFFNAVDKELKGIELPEVIKRTPKRSGELRSTEKVITTKQPRRILSRIVAGGPTAPYALIVHENLDAFHPVGQAKYIESVLFESRQYLANRFAKRVSLKRMAT